MRLAIPRAGALVRGLIVNRQSRVMRDVNGPIRQARQALRQTWAAAQILLGLSGIEKFPSSICLAPVSPPRRPPTATPGNEEDGPQSYRGRSHGRSIPAVSSAGGAV